MEKEPGKHKLTKGIWFSWLSLLMFPLAVLLGFVGVCAGPESTGGAWLLFSIGAFGFLAAVYGAFRIIRGIRFGGWILRILGVLSFCTAILAGYIGWELARFGAESVREFLHFR
jgi:hypothetical protein